MNSFDLCIPSVGVPSNLGMSAGRASLRELSALQQGRDRADRRLTRVLGEPREFLRRFMRRLACGGRADAAVSTKGWAMLR